ncbi:MAG: hypothetical protein HFI37_00110 [Lachnospiraceae bacterium]|nr:hypothetical protein [Lachnospiraceae bacterium]
MQGEVNLNCKKNMIYGNMGVLVILCLTYQLYERDFFSVPEKWVEEIIKTCSVCFVIMFVLLGFWMNEKGQSEKSLKNLWKISGRYIAKIYLNYWVFYLLFSYLIFAGKTGNLYGENKCYLLLDFLGMSQLFGIITTHKCAGYLGLMALGLLLFPILRVGVQYVPFSVLMGAILGISVAKIYCPIQALGKAIYYTAGFALGMCISEIGIEKKVTYPADSLLWQGLIYIGKNAFSIAIVTGFLLESGYGNDLYPYKNFLAVVIIVLAEGLTLSLLIEGLKRKLLFVDSYEKWRMIGE